MNETIDGVYDKSMSMQCGSDRSMQQRQSLITVRERQCCCTTHQSDRIPTSSSNLGINRANERYLDSKAENRISWLSNNGEKKTPLNLDGKCDTDNLTAVKSGGTTEAD